MRKTITCSRLCSRNWMCGLLSNRWQALLCVGAGRSLSSVLIRPLPAVEGFLPVQHCSTYIAMIFQELCVMSRVIGQVFTIVLTFQHLKTSFKLRIASLIAFFCILDIP